MRKTKTHLYLVLIFGLALLIGVGYALLTSNLNIFGTTTINKASWDVHFENIKVTDGSVTATTPASIDANKTMVNYTISLNMPGDFYEFTVDEVNKGTIDAMVSSIVTSGLTESQAKYINYSVTYSDGTIVSEKQLLAAGGKETVKVRVEFKKDITAQDLPTTNQTLNLSFSLNYTQADDSALVIRPEPVCKRATTLHTETCSSSYCSGVLEYGSLGTKGILTSGDAFDCDVNGDGIYNEETERFYYISDLDTNNDYAVLSYYSNVEDGVPSDNKSYSYNINKSEYLGPQQAMLKLPTTAQWKNISLSNTTRNITDENGTVRVSGFSYEGYAARFLTIQEVNNACGIIAGNQNQGELNSCKYLMENTKYGNSLSSLFGSYLENVDSSSTSSYWYTFVAEQYVRSYSGNNGVRPAIEVEKVNMNY